MFVSPKQHSKFPVSVALLFAACALARAVDPVPTGHWTFDARDASGGYPGLNGAAVATPIGEVQATNGKMGQGVEIGVNRGALVIPAGLDEFVGDSFTISFWAKYDGNKSDQTSGYSTLFSTNNFPYGLFIQFQQGVKVDVAARGVWHINNSKQQSQANRDFVHIAYVFDGVKGTLYVDGKPHEEDSETPVGSWKYGSEIVLGAGNTKNRQGQEITPEEFGNPFVGVIDDLRIYNVALTPEQITALQTK